VLGYTPWERRCEYKKLFALVSGQKSQLWWDLPANESFYLNKYIYGIETREYEKTVEELSELLDVVHLLKVQVRRLSLGERMKLELISSLIHKPQVLFLDEPTIGLDIISQRKIRDFLRYYNEQNQSTILLTSHYVRDIQDLCNRVIVINKGKIVYDDELSRITEIFGKKKIVKFHSSKYIDKTELCNFGTIEEYDGYDIVLKIDNIDLKECMEKIMRDFDVNDLNIENINIEEGIAYIYQQNLEE